jgi:6-methylsalicylate decarboxylase
VIRGERARAGRELFGSDWPFAYQEAVGYFTGQLDAYPGLDSQTRAAIDHVNAAALFPRLAPPRPQPALATS